MSLVASTDLLQVLQSGKDGAEPATISDGYGMLKCVVALLVHTISSGNSSIKPSRQMLMRSCARELLRPRSCISVNSPRIAIANHARKRLQAASLVDGTNRVDKV